LLLGSHQKSLTRSNNKTETTGSNPEQTVLKYFDITNVWYELDLL